MTSSSSPHDTQLQLLSERDLLKERIRQQEEDIARAQERNATLLREREVLTGTVLSKITQTLPLHPFSSERPPD
jgi:hypothetical protein